MCSNGVLPISVGSLATYITTAHSALGGTEIVFEGVPTYPDAGRFWKMRTTSAAFLHGSNRHSFAHQGG